MKIGPFEIGRRHAVAAQEPAATPTPRREYGSSGTINLSGFLQNLEKVNELRGRAGLELYERMRRSDPSVREALQLIKAPIRNATWLVEPASDDPLDLEVAEFVRCAYFEWLERPWLEHLGQALAYLDFGFRIFETPWKVVEESLTITDPDTGDTHDLPSRQFLTYRRFADRLPQTIFKWNVADGELQSVTQVAFKDGDYGHWEIPAESLLRFTHELEGDDFTGLSLLRSAYKPWLMKETIEKIATASVERWGMGIPVAGVPRSRQNDDGVLDRVEDMLANLRAGEFSYLVFDGPVNLNSQDGETYTFSIEGPKGSPPNFNELLAYHRGEIKAAVLARFMELGHGRTGARNTADTQSEIWRSALHAVARDVADVHAIAIKRLVDANYTVTDYPTLTAQDIESRNFAEFAQGMSQLVASGAIVADGSFREFVRKASDAPDEDDPAANDAVLHPPTADPTLEPETQPGDGVKPTPQERAQAARLTELSGQLEALAREVQTAYKRDDRDELSREVFALARSLSERQVNVKVDVEPRYEAHEHSHEHSHEGASVEEIKALLADAKDTPVSSRQIDRYADGRIKRVRELDAEGQLLRTRSPRYHDKKLIGFDDEPAANQE